MDLIKIIVLLIIPVYNIIISIYTISNLDSIDEKYSDLDTIHKLYILINILIIVFIILCNIL